MASPTVRGTPAEGAGASATTHTITFAQNTGDRVVIFLANDATARTWSLGDSFTNLTNTSATFHIFTKVLDGSEGGNMVATAGVATKSAWIAYNITAGYHLAATAPVFSTVATGTSTAPNAGSLTPAGGSADYLWLTAFGQAGEEADDDTWVSGTPTSFSGLLQKATGTSGAVTVNCSVASAQYAHTNSVLDAAAFTTAQSLAWRAYTVAIYPAVRLDISVTAATGTGAATAAATTHGTATTAATGTGTATNPTVTHIDWTWGTYSATFSNATGTALNVSVTAATGTGAASNAGRTTGPVPVAATGTGLASNAGRTAGVATTAATGTGAATNPAVSLVAALNISVTAATGTGAIVSPAFSVSRSPAVIGAVGIGSATL